jgi:hypothetical protein
MVSNGIILNDLSKRGQIKKLLNVQAEQYTILFNNNFEIGYPCSLNISSICSIPLGGPQEVGVRASGKYHVLIGGITILRERSRLSKQYLQVMLRLTTTQWCASVGLLLHLHCPSVRYSVR